MDVHIAKNLLGIGIASCTERSLPYFKVSGGPLVGEQQMGIHVTSSRGHTLAVSCDRTFARLSACAPHMAMALLKLLYHYHRGDELKDHAGAIYDAVQLAFDRDDWDELLREYESQRD